MPTQTVKEFLTDSYQLISASSPFTGLTGSDMFQGTLILNRLLRNYSSTGLMLTIAQFVTYELSIGQLYVTLGGPDYIPTPDITIGRLANLSEAWLLLDGVTYPLVMESRDVFNASYKYDPQVGLPRFIIVYNDTNLTRIRLYPGPSQTYQLNFYGKFELNTITEDSNMSSLPDYYLRFLQFATARDIAFYKGRSQAWTKELNDMYIEAKQDMEATSTVNLIVQTENESLLNGSWRVMAGV
jgi:hypothetical protein